MTAYGSMIRTSLIHLPYSLGMEKHPATTKLLDAIDQLKSVTCAFEARVTTKRLIRCILYSDMHDVDKERLFVGVQRMVDDLGISTDGGLGTKYGLIKINDALVSFLAKRHPHLLPNHLRSR